MACHFLLASTVVSAPSISYHLLLLYQTTLSVKDTETIKQTLGLGKTHVNDPPKPWEVYTVQSSWDKLDGVSHICLFMRTGRQGVGSTGL